MIAQRYKDMLSGKSVIRQISEWSTARGTEIGYENVFDYSLGNPSVPCPEHFTKTCIDLLQTKEPVTLHGYSPTLTIPTVRKAVADLLVVSRAPDEENGNVMDDEEKRLAMQHLEERHALRGGAGAGYYHLCAVLPGIQAVCGGRGPESEGRSAPHEGFPD